MRDAVVGFERDAQRHLVSLLEETLRLDRLGLQVVGADSRGEPEFFHLVVSAAFHRALTRVALLLTKFVSERVVIHEATHGWVRAGVHLDEIQARLLSAAYRDDGGDDLVRSLLPAGVAAAVAGVGDEPNLSRGNLLIDAMARGGVALRLVVASRARVVARGSENAPGRTIRRDHAAGETGGRRDDERRPDPERRRRSVVPRKHAREDARDGDGRARAARRRGRRQPNDRPEHLSRPRHRRAACPRSRSPRRTGTDPWLTRL